jgi:hypothetical protein
MKPDTSNRPPLSETILVALFAGLMLGIFYAWHEWSWNNFFAGIAAGIGFMITYLFLTSITKPSAANWRLYMFTAISGAGGGLMWWLVAKTSANITSPILIGAIGAPVAMWLEAGNSEKKRSRERAQF